MTKQLTLKEHVVVYVRYQPNCAVGDVSEVLQMADSLLGRLLREFSDEKVNISLRNNVQHICKVVPHTNISDAILSRMMEKRPSQDADCFTK